MLSPVSELLLVFALLVAFPAGTELQPQQQQEAASCRAEYRGLAGAGLVHTACRAANPNCHIMASGLSGDEKTGLLLAHNELRSKVAGGLLPGFKPAANMLELKWDNDLAEVAQAHARQCGAHPHEDHEERKTTKFTTVGQNLGWEASSEPFPDHSNLSHPKTWAEEHKDVKANVVRSYHGTEGGTGQFTQMIWANTRYVGCGVTTYTRKDNVGRYPYQRSLTCNYGPGGNVPGMAVYEEGETCSRCPNGSACIKGSGLCTVDEAMFPYKGPEEQVAPARWNWTHVAAGMAFLLWLCV